MKLQESVRIHRKPRNFAISELIKNKKLPTYSNTVCIFTRVQYKYILRSIFVSFLTDVKCIINAELLDWNNK